MESLFFEVKLLVVLFLSGIYVRSSFGFKEYASIQSPQFKESRSSKYPVQQQQHQKVPAEEREKVNTISVTCHPDSLEILIKADMFEVGAPVNVDELRLGVEYNEICRATASSRDEYRIVVGLLDCGTKHWVTMTLLQFRHLFVYYKL